MSSEIITKVCEIITIAMNFNCTPTRRKFTADKPTIFYDFCGHTSTFDVQIYFKGWEEEEPYCHADKYYVVELDKPDAVKQLEEILECLKTVIDEWEW